MNQRQLFTGRSDNGRPCATAIFKTTWGWMGLAASPTGLTGIVLPQVSRRLVEQELNGSRSDEPGEVSDALLSRARTQLLEFLAGTRRTLDLPVDLSGGTAFQRRVWRAALGIPYGRVRSYKWLAQRVGGAQYARAVGLALGANPVPIMVPCHRIVAQDGSLGGFSCGLRAKRQLLRLEGTLEQLK